MMGINYILKHMKTNKQKGLKLHNIYIYIYIYIYIDDIFIKGIQPR